MNPEWCAHEMISRTAIGFDKGLIHPVPHYVRHGWVCEGRRGGVVKQ